MTAKAELGLAVTMVLGSAVFVAIALRLVFFSHSATAVLFVDASAAEDAGPVNAIVGKLQRDQCDLFVGKWIENPAGPAYTNASCKFIDARRDCMTNGRPDLKYFYWRWKPDGCELSLFNTKKFLNQMRNKSWVFIGDSILRNQLASLLCLLSKAEEVVPDKTFKSSMWHIPSHNFTIAAIWAPFLLKSSNEADNITVHLDTLESRWTSRYNDYDYLVISGGHWFLKTTIFVENDTIIGCNYCPGMSLPALGSDFAYRKALQLAFRFILNSDHKPLVLFRTWTPDHFEFGKWYNGGVCNRTKPYKEGEFSGHKIDHIMRGLEIEEFQEVLTLGTQNGTRIRLLDTYHLSLLRPDGHPGRYWRLHPDLSNTTHNDCLHWCLPGPVEAWNDIVMEMVLKEGELGYSS